MLECIEIAVRLGFVEATEPDFDGVCVAYIPESGTHAAYVEAPHELARGEATTGMLKAWGSLLQNVRDQTDEASGSAILRPWPGVVIRPLGRVPLAITRADVDELHAELHSPHPLEGQLELDSWPVLDADPPDA